jgi:hypothetical protein
LLDWRKQTLVLLLAKIQLAVLAVAVFGITEAGHGFGAGIGGAQAVAKVALQGTS